MGLTVYGGGGKPEEEKTVTAGTSVIEVNPSSGKVMKKVTVNPTPTESKSVTAGTEDITVSPTDGKHLSGVTVHPTPTQEKTVIPTADGFKVSPETGKLLSAVFVDGDSDLVAENIKQGVNIFGVDGTLTSLEVKTGTIKTTGNYESIAIPHGLGRTPLYGGLISTTFLADSDGDVPFNCTVDSTNLTITLSNGLAKIYIKYYSNIKWFVVG